MFTGDTPQFLASPPQPGEDMEMWSRALYKWLLELSSAIGRRDESLDRVLNGEVEFPDPWTLSHDSNIRLRFRIAKFDEFDFTWEPASIYNPHIEVNPSGHLASTDVRVPDSYPKEGFVFKILDHGIAPIAAGIVGGAYPAYHYPIILNQTISSAHPRNGLNDGYTSCNVTAIGGGTTTIVGEGSSDNVGSPVPVAAGWTGNNVLTNANTSPGGDEILVLGTIAERPDVRWRRILTLDGAAPETMVVEGEVQNIAIGGGKAYIIRRNLPNITSWRIFGDTSVLTDPQTTVILAFT